MFKNCLCILILLCLHATVNAQNSNIDSLLHLLQNAKEDTNTVNLLRNIGVAYANHDPMTAIAYWKQGVTLSRKLNYTVGAARNFINIGTGYSYLGKFDSTIIYADSGIFYSKKTNDPERLALAYLNKGDGYRNLGDFKSALLYCDTASMYMGPAVMYFVNLVSLIAFCLVNMFNEDVYLSLMVLSPLPLLAITIYFVNTIIHKKSEKVQALLSDLTTNAQESYIIFFSTTIGG